MASLLKNICGRFSIEKLNTYQQECIELVKNRRDVFISTKTGSGKSLCFQMLPEIVGERGIVIVFSPLKAIMEEQVQYLKIIGYSAAIINKESIVDIEQGKFQFLYGNPEAIIGEDTIRTLLTSDLYRKRTSYIIVDEAHTVMSWGEATQYEAAFRQTFAKIGDIRSLLPNVPIMALTATASRYKRQKIMKCLGMTNCVEIVDSPDRENVKLSVDKVSGNTPLEEVFDWLVEILNNEGSKMPRYIVFCKSIRDCSRIYKMLREKATDAKYFNMYHSMTPSNVKQLICEDMSKSDGNIRILVATNAAGMGINFAGINNVVNFGPPSDMDTYLQQVGRAGRGGDQGQALLVYLPSQMRNLDTDMLAYVRNTTDCRRDTILKYYNAKKSTILNHLCCDLCSIDCHCGMDTDGSCPILIHEGLRYILADSDSDTSMETIPYREVTSDEQEELKYALIEYKKSVDTPNQLVMDTISYGCIAQIVTMSGSLFDMDDLMSATSVPNVYVAQDVMSIISKIFDTETPVIDMDCEEDDN